MMTKNSIDQPSPHSISTNLSSRPELLAPAGDFSSLRVAIGNGADAVYIGAGAFNARQNAANFDSAQLAEAIRYAHQRSVRVYLTMNTLIADDEGDLALDLAAAAYAAGIDAIIIQDIGLISVLHSLLPDLPLFASTQMTISNEAGLRSAARLGLRRVILPRELSIEEISRLTRLARNLGLETEVFIHGALCVSYSGQCLLSSLIGGRSGNRGGCAQPCRLSYQLTDAKDAPSGQPADRPWPWLSPRDQSLIEYLPALSQAGVSSLKIEGRMRSSAYVGQVVALYREALDQNPAQQQMPEHLNKTNRQLLMAFNRGGSFTDRYPSGKRLADFLSGSYPGSFGLLLGKIIGLEPRQGILKLILDSSWPNDECPERGDVLSVRRDQADQESASAPIGSIVQQGRILLIKGFHPDILMQLNEGDLVYRMSNHRLEMNVLEANCRKTPIEIEVKENLDNPADVMLTAVVTNGLEGTTGFKVSCSREADPVNALSPERLAQQLKKTGQTPFRVLTIRQSGDIHLSIASINEMRRQLLADLAQQIVLKLQRQMPSMTSRFWEDAIRKEASSVHVQAAEQQMVAPVSAYMHQLPDADGQVACGADRYYLPILALTSSRALAIRQEISEKEPASRVLAWLPPAASGRAAELLPKLIRELPQWGFDGLCVGQSGLDLLFDGLTDSDSPHRLELVADTGANIFNQAAQLNYIRQGAKVICPSLEISGERLQSLLQMANLTGIPLELPIYGRLRLMISEFCPVGQNLQNCKRCHHPLLSAAEPDKSRAFFLKDRKHQSFPILTHPRVCTSELLSQFILCAPHDLCGFLADKPNKSDIQIRLYFKEETLAEKMTLTGICRKMLAAADSKTRLAYADEFQKNAQQIASRFGSQLSFGHYRRGV